MRARVCMGLYTSVGTCVIELVMWTELFMSGQTGQQHVTVTRGSQWREEGEGGGVLRWLKCGLVKSLMY